MRMKKFTLLTLALLLMSVVAFAQKKAPTNVTPTAQQQELQAMDWAKEKFGAFDLNHKILPQFKRKASMFNLPAEFKTNGSRKSATQNRLTTNAQPVKATYTVKANHPSPSWGQGTSANSSRRGAPPAGSLFYDNFESGDLSSWTLKTLGEGSSWAIGEPAQWEICDAHSGNYVASSFSWSNGAFHVDNWLITPKVALGGSVVFWTYTNKSYPDKYEVLLSTTGTETTDFTVSLKPMAADAGGAWQLYVLDLSEYDGQEGYVAIHHQDYDMNYLLIDDFAITGEPYVAPTPVTPPTDLQTIPFTILAYDSNENPFERVLNIGVDGTDVYLQGASYYLPDAWIKGTLNQNGTVTFATGQYCGEDGIYPVYLQAYDYNTSTTLDNLTISYNILTGSITWPDVLIMDCGSPEGLDELYQYYEVVQVKPGIVPDPLTPPAGIENSLVEYRMEGDAYDSDGNPMTYSEPIFIGINGTDVWVKGVCKDFSNTWIKGTLNGNTVTFPTGQHFATYDPYEGTYYEGYYIYKFFFAGYDINSGAQADVTMTLDSNTGIYTMTSPDMLMINSEWLISDPNIFFLTAQFVPVADKAATPAQPEITDATFTGSYPNVKIYVPYVDTEGNDILSSKLSYQYYYDVETVVTPLTLNAADYSNLENDMTEIPYYFADDGIQGQDISNEFLYLKQNFSTWNKIGIQSIYRGGGEENRSEIFWYTITPYHHEITFVAADDYNIQNGMATVQVNGKKATVDADGKLSVSETYIVTLTAAKGYRFVSVTSTDATIELDKKGFVATFEMPEDDITVNYEMRELYNEVQFATTGEYTIQDGHATVSVDGDDVTDIVDESGKLLDVATDATVTITATPGFKLTDVTASYREKAAGGGSGELTVHDGSAMNAYVPVYGFYADAYLKSEFVMPAAELADMAGSNINSMKFYLSQPAEGPWNSTFQVFLKEVAETEISTFSGTDGATVVYEGTLNGTDSEMEITFTTPYQYNGGNLLIGVYNLTEGTYKSVTFLGETVNGACVQGYSYSSLDAISPTQRNFLPKTTFTYASGSGGGAAEVQVGSGDLIKNYLPTYNLYNYSVTQQIYTASEIGQAGSINSIAYYCTSNAVARNLDVYLVHTSNDAFDSTTDWIVVSESDKVFSGDVDFAQEAWTTITLDKPFNYNGTDNLCVIVDDNTGNWHSSMQFKVYDATNQSIVIYDDNTNYEISSISSFEGYYKTWKNQMVLGMSTAPAIDLDVNLAADGNSASFTVPEGTVTVNYELVRLGYSINVPADTYITYYTDKDITIYDEDCELLTVTAVDETTVTATPIEVAAAETPLLIYNSSKKKKELWIVPTEEALEELTPDEVEVAPEFKGTLEEKTFTAAEMSAAEHFICNGEAFIWVRSEGTIGANKCWLELSNDEPLTARAIVIGSGETTGVKAIDHSPLTIDNYYDLQGRRIAQPTKGFYIMNGKKVFVK